MLLGNSISELHTLYNQLLASVTQLLILLLQCLAHFEQIEAFLFPNGCNRSIIALQHLELELHLLHFLDNLLSLHLLLH